MVAEFWHFLRHNKKWWLLPIVVILVVLRRAGLPVGHRGGAVHLHAVLIGCGDAARSGLPSAASSLSRRCSWSLRAPRGARRRCVCARGCATAAPSTGVRDPMLVYDPCADLNVPRPGYEVRAADPYQDQLAGIPRRRVQPQKPAADVRIVCLGASTTFWAEVSSNDTTWPHRLQEKLQAGVSEGEDRSDQRRGRRLRRRPKPEEPPPPCAAARARSGDLLRGQQRDRAGHEGTGDREQGSRGRRRRQSPFVGAVVELQPDVRSGVQEPGDSAGAAVDTAPRSWIRCRRTCRITSSASSTRCGPIWRRGTSRWCCRRSS